MGQVVEFNVQHVYHRGAKVLQRERLDLVARDPIPMT